MFSNKWFYIALVIALVALAAVLLKPKPIEITTTPPSSSYSQCCRSAEGERVCVNQAGQPVEYTGRIALAELALCPDGEKPSNKPDFSRHQILTPNDILAKADCCALNANTKRCQLPNGPLFEMPLAKAEPALQACAE